MSERTTVNFEKIPVIVPVRLSSNAAENITFRYIEMVSCLLLVRIDYIGSDRAVRGQNREA